MWWKVKLTNIVDEQNKMLLTLTSVHGQNIKAVHTNSNHSSIKDIMYIGGERK